MVSSAFRRGPGGAALAWGTAAVLAAHPAMAQPAGAGAAVRSAPVSTQCRPDSPAARALDALLRGYEQGDLNLMQQRLAPDLPGLGFVLDGVTRQRLAPQTRLTITERQMQCGPDVTVIDFAWEKRWLDGAGLTPRLVQGRSSVLISGLGQGLDGPWRLSGLVGDNPFAPPAPAAVAPPAPAPAPSPAPAPLPGVPGTLTALPASASFGGLPSGCAPAPPLTVSVAVQALATDGVTQPVTIAAGGACSVPGYSIRCRLDGSGLEAAVDSVATLSASCTASTMTVPLAASGSLTFSHAGGVVTVSGPAGSTQAVTVPVNGSAGPTTIAMYTVTGVAVGVCSGNVRLAAAPPSPPVCSGAAGALAVTIQVTDADLDAPSVAVSATASNGDSETLVLPRVAAGQYRLDSLPVLRGAAAVSPGNGRIDLVGASPGAVTLTLRYTDQLPGGGAPPGLREATLTLLP